MPKIITALLLFLVSVSPALAHVGYVIDKDQFEATAGVDVSYSIAPFTQTHNIILVIATLIAIAVVYWFATHVSLALKEIKFIKKEAQSYRDLVPWMLRLSLGIALIGAGTSEVLISPLLETTSPFPFLQILVGFMMMAGFLLPLATILIIGLYLIALSQDFYILGNLDLLAAAVALLVEADGHPGIDDLIGLPFPTWFKSIKQYTPLIIRFGLGTAMIFLAVYEKLLNPHTTELVVQLYQLDQAIPVSGAMWVSSAGLIEAAIGVAILFGFFTRVSTTIAVLVLSMSFFYFKEDVYSHITLFGLMSILFVTGGGSFSLDQLLMEKKKSKLIIWIYHLFPALKKRLINN